MDSRPLRLPRRKRLSGRTDSHLADALSNLFVLILSLSKDRSMGGFSSHQLPLFG
jgi:hypothetical protein